MKVTVEGSRERGYAVVVDGGIEYDLLESRSEAMQIAALIRKGVGPEWDAIEPLLGARSTTDAER